MDNNELINLGREIKKFFIFYKKENSPSFFMNKRFDKEEYWVKAAKLCDEFNLGAEEFVKTFFDFVTKPYSKVNFPVLPQHLGGSLGRQAIKNYLVYLNSTQNKPNVVKSAEDIVAFSSALRDTSTKIYVEDSFNFVNKLINTTNNSNDLKIPKNKSIFRLHLYSIPSWLRVLLNPDDDYIIKEFGKEALYQLDGGIPNLKSAIEEKLGLNSSYNNASIVDRIITNLKSYDFK